MTGAATRLVLAAAFGLAFGVLAGCGGGGGGGGSELDDGAGFPASNDLSSCTASPCSTLVITNSCGSPLPVNFSYDDSAAYSPATCGTIAHGSSCPTLHLQDDKNIVFFFGSQEKGSTVAEFNINQNIGGKNQDIYDISLNQGFDVGMQIVASNTQNDGTTPAFPAICLDDGCPGAFCLGDSAACTRPCLQPEYYVLAGGQFTLELCPQGVENSPGPVGCTVTQPAGGTSQCTPTWQQDNGVCTWQPTHAQLPVPGQSPCPASCP
jgi:hypothetical protein